MGTSDDSIITGRGRERASPRSGLARARRAGSLTGGGADGNERLTTVTGAILIVLLAAIGFTIPQLRQYIWMHLFVGLLLIGPVLLKMASTGYRFARYYTRNAEYRRKGPPELILRLIAPIVVLSTVGVFVTGIGLLIVGPTDRNPMLLLHKRRSSCGSCSRASTSSVICPRWPGRSDSATRTDAVAGRGLGRLGPGAAGRWIALAGAIVGGLVLAVALIPDFATWTAHSVFVHHHHPN